MGCWSRGGLELAVLGLVRRARARVVRVLYSMMGDTSMGWRMALVQEVWAS